MNRCQRMMMKRVTWQWRLSPELKTRARCEVEQGWAGLAGISAPDCSCIGRHLLILIAGSAAVIHGCVTNGQPARPLVSLLAVAMPGVAGRRGTGRGGAGWG